MKKRLEPREIDEAPSRHAMLQNAFPGTPESLLFVTSNRAVENQPPTDVPAVVLNLQSLSSPILEGREVVVPSSWMDHEDHAVCQAEVDRLWSLVRSEAGSQNVDFVELYARQLLVAYVTWKWMIGKVVRNLHPKEVWLPRPHLSMVSALKGWELNLDLFEALLASLLYEEVRNNRMNVHLYESRPAQTDVNFFLAGRVSQARRKSLQDVHQSIRYSFRTALGGYKPPSKKIRSPILIVGQESKAQALLESLPSQLPHEFLHYQDFEALFKVKPSQATSAWSFTETESVGAQLFRIIRAVAQSLRALPGEIEDFIRSPWRVLITDYPQHPLMRQVLPYALESGKSVATIPEGGVANRDELNLLGSWSSATNDPRITRFVLSSAVASRIEERLGANSQVLVSGYLVAFDDRYRLGKVLDPPLRMKSQRRLFRSTRRMAIVDASFDARAPYAFTVLGVPGWIESWLAQMRILRAFLDDGWTVVAATRHPWNARHVERFVRHQDLISSSLLSWDVFLDQADVVVTSRSSIGWESIARGKPVVIAQTVAPRVDSIKVGVGPLPPFWMEEADDSEAVLQVARTLSSEVARQARRSWVRRHGMKGPVSSHPGVVCEWIRSRL